MRYVVSIIVILGLVTPIWAGSFPDVPKDHWAYQAVAKLEKLGIVKGYPDPPKKKPIAKPKAYEWHLDIPKGAAQFLYVDISEQDFLPGLQKLLTTFKIEALEEKQMAPLIEAVKDIFKDLKRVKVIAYKLAALEPAQKTIDFYKNTLEKKNWRTILWFSQAPEQAVSVFALGDRKGLFGVFVNKTDVFAFQLEGFFDLGKLFAVATQIGTLTAGKEKPKEEKPPAAESSPPAAPEK